MQSDLGAASNSYELRQIHEDCKSKFNEGSPNRVVASLQKRLESKTRDEAKLKQRIENLIQRDSRDIRSLVIDGSNLCYEGDKLIGLFAIRALHDSLSPEIQRTIVFDGSVLKRLGLPDDATLRRQLPGINVSIVKNLAGADETILDAAQDATSYVVSGDRFAEYPDKQAIKEGRILIAQVLNGRVIVPDLDINAAYQLK